MEVTFKRQNNDNEGQEITRNVSPDLKLGDVCTAIRSLFKIQEHQKCKLILERTGGELKGNLTIRQAGVLMNDRIILVTDLQTEQKTESLRQVSQNSMYEDSQSFAAQANSIHPLQNWQIIVLTSGVFGAFAALCLTLILSKSLSPASQGNAPTLAPAVTSVGQKSSPQPVSKTPPEQALKDYYQNINDSKYQTAWGSLSLRLRQSTIAHPEGYKSYTDWWTQVAKVDVVETNLVSQTDFNCTVDSQLRYLTKSGRRIDQVLRFYFTWDRNSSRWLINRVERLSSSELIKNNSNASANKFNALAIHNLVNRGSVLLYGKSGGKFVGQTTKSEIREREDFKESGVAANIKWDDGLTSSILFMKNSRVRVWEKGVEYGGYWYWKLNSSLLYVEMDEGSQYQFKKGR